MQIYEKIALRMHFASINTSSSGRAQKEDRLSPGLMRSISNRSITTLVEQTNVVDAFTVSKSNQTTENDSETQSVNPDNVIRVMRMNSLKRKRRSYAKRNVQEPHAEYLKELEKKSIAVSKLSKLRQAIASLGSDRPQAQSNSLSPDTCTSMQRTASPSVRFNETANKVANGRSSIMSLLFSVSHDDSLLDVSQACLAASVLCAPVLSSADLTEVTFASQLNKPKADFKCNKSVLDQSESLLLLNNRSDKRGKLSIGNVPTITIDKPTSSPKKEDTPFASFTIGDDNNSVI